jgi:putative tricarboxylic transport membrane protein
MRPVDEVVPGMTREQVAYWDQVFAKTVASREWKEILARNFWADEYRDSARTKAFLDEDYRELRAILSDLGLAK